MTNDLTMMIERLEEQSEYLESNLSKNVQQIRSMGARALTQLKRARRDISSLPHSTDWMKELLHTVDLLGEIERFLNDLECIRTFPNKSEEMVSLESIMEQDVYNSI